jgi:hypothetical protein
MCLHRLCLLHLLLCSFCCLLLPVKLYLLLFLLSVAGLLLPAGLLHADCLLLLLLLHGGCDVPLQ